MNQLIVLMLVTASILLTGCSNTPKEEVNRATTSVVLPDDFVDFLDEFHTNEEFQKAHIQWPLQGVPTMMEEESDALESFRWTAGEWVIHRGFDSDNEEYELNYPILDNDMVVEQILHINGSMGMERRFAKMDGEWMLIYYAGMNMIKQSN